MSPKTTLRSSRLVMPALLALALAAAPSGAAAADVELEIVKIKATGAPTGAGPVLDEAIKDLPAIAGICRMYARCEHDGTTVRRLAWGEDLVLGRGKARIAVMADKAGPGDKHPVTVLIGTEDRPCMENTSAVSPGKPLVRFCERSLPDGTYIFLITARPL